MAVFTELLRSSKNIIAVCGAGLSAASGKPLARTVPSHALEHA